MRDEIKPSMTKEQEIEAQLRIKQDDWIAECKEVTRLEGVIKALEGIIFQARHCLERCTLGDELYEKINAYEKAKAGK